MPLVRGSSHHSAQLTEAKVRAILRLYYHRAWKVSCIAHAYRVSYNTIWDIVQRNTWFHVPIPERVAKK